MTCDDKRSGLILKVSNLGPIRYLEGKLSTEKRNVVYARNGMGKSFISEAMRHIELINEEEICADAAALVSDESVDGSGTLALSDEGACLASINLDRIASRAASISNDVILHVFTDGFTASELLENEFVLDGNITHEILVDSDNIEINKLQDDEIELKQEYEKSIQGLEKTFSSAANTVLVKRADIKKNLVEFRNLNPLRLLKEYDQPPHIDEGHFEDILASIGAISSIPQDPNLVSVVSPPNVDSVDFEKLDSLLNQVTDSSDVSDEVKTKLDKNIEFYKSGLSILRNEGSDICPFCTQSVTGQRPRSAIETYQKYFDGAEESHKAQLNIHLNNLKQLQEQLQKSKKQVKGQISEFNALIIHAPSITSNDLDNIDDCTDEAINSLDKISKIIELKKEMLDKSFSLESSKHVAFLLDVNSAIEENNVVAKNLNEKIQDSVKERLRYQRDACIEFEKVFVSENWNQFSNLKRIENYIKESQDSISVLRKKAISGNSREMVANTFDHLLKYFFQEKYIFNKENFSITRGEYNMERGAHRTLSTGEKSIIAFCYFIATTHMKISTIEDYAKILLVFDDPVTSMSYDYVYKIARVFNEIRIHPDTAITFEDGIGDDYKRPRILIFTHSSLFFNVLASNKIIGGASTFALSHQGERHILSKIHKIITPFHEQLRDVYRVAEGGDPDHTTANSARSVLEYIGRVCRPDKTKTVTGFIRYLSDELNLPVSGILLNTMSHSLPDDEAASPDEIKGVCQEVIQVAEHFVPGQLEVIRH